MISLIFAHSRPISLVVEELLHCLGASGLGIEETHFALLGEKIVGCLIDAHTAHHAQAFLDRAQRLRILFGERFRQRHGLGAEPIARHGFVDQPDFGGLLAVERLAGHRVPDGVAIREAVHDDLTDEAAGKDAPVYFRQSKLRVVRRDREVAGEELNEGAAKTVAIDHRDGRLRESAQQRPAPFMIGKPGEIALLRLVVEIAEEQLDILSRAPAIARAGKNDDARVFILGQFLEDVDHLEMQLRTHRIALLRTIQRDECRSVLALDAHRLQCAEVHLTLPYRSEVFHVRPRLCIEPVQIMSNNQSIDLLCLDI